jgi:hypothetical protein
MKFFTNKFGLRQLLGSLIFMAAFVSISSLQARPNPWTPHVPREVFLSEGCYQVRIVGDHRSQCFEEGATCETTTYSGRCRMSGNSCTCVWDSTDPGSNLWVWPEIISEN